MNLSTYINGTYGTMYYVNDMKKSTDYYKNVLNLTAEMESPEWTSFIVNDHRICLHGIKPGEKLKANSFLILSVKNLEEVVTELKKREVEIVKGITEVCENGYSVDIMDPNGNLVSLFEYKG